jgi:hypothetical protein
MAFKAASDHRDIWGRWVTGIDQGMTAIKKVIFGQGTAKPKDPLHKISIDDALLLPCPQALYESAHGRFHAVVICPGNRTHAIQPI